MFVAAVVFVKTPCAKGKLGPAVRRKWIAMALRLPLLSKLLMSTTVYVQLCCAAALQPPAYMYAPPACSPPPKDGAYPLVEDLPKCSAFPDPWLRSDNTRVTSTTEWVQHRTDMIKLLENYMYGHAPEQPPVRSTLKASAKVTEYCERVRSWCNQAPSERNVTGCEMRCVPLKTPQMLRNYTLRVGPTADRTWPFDVFVYTPAFSSGPVPFVVYNGEGFYSGVEFGDLTAQGAKVLLDRGFGLALFNRNELRKDHKTGGCATAGCGMGEPDGVQTLYPDHDWSTINVWAWGAAHVLDFLLSDDTVSARCLPDS